MAAHVRNAAAVVARNPGTAAVAGVVTVGAVALAAPLAIAAPVLAAVGFTAEGVAASMFHRCCCPSWYRKRRRRKCLCCVPECCCWRSWSCRSCHRYTSCWGGCCRGSCRGKILLEKAVMPATAVGRCGRH
ncbi:hypothetical protein B0T21DRAFT_34039 [Apiosordaria backusii]|uniref:Uncharacterized protein n=1 Tax=Apiosordaria backusii TaxID=314023 RepID=A0AA40B2D9_9PEZI|nr:hypothetical protein B0T21DRAFT_34039 [Apiosordaria backusii]